MKKVIRLTESDLVKLVKQVISEQKFTILSKLLSNGGDDLVKVYGDDVVKNIDDLLSKALSNTKNVGVNSLGKQFLKSASGSEIPLDKIQQILNAISKGANIDELANYLPRQLADGSDFRLIIQNLLKNKKTSGGLSSLYNFSQQGQMFKKMIEDWSGWIQLLTPKGNMSGWKLHVLTNTVDETAFALEKIIPLSQKYGAGVKAAAEDMLQRLANNPLQKGKGITIYIPSTIVKNNQQRIFLKELQDALKGLNTKGSISGDMMITNNIGYRYEFSKPINAAIGADDATYRQLYSSNDGGPHNIQGNVDIFN